MASFALASTASNCVFSMSRWLRTDSLFASSSLMLDASDCRVDTSLTRCPSSRVASRCASAGEPARAKLTEIGKTHKFEAVRNAAMMTIDMIDGKMPASPGASGSSSSGGSASDGSR